MKEKLEKIRKNIVFYLRTLYNKHILFKGNLCERRCYINMSGYMLVWILLQKIEKLEEELNTYKNKTTKN